MVHKQLYMDCFWQGFGSKNACKLLAFEESLDSEHLGLAFKPKCLKWNVLKQCWHFASVEVFLPHHWWSFRQKDLNFFFFPPSGFSLGAWLTGRSPVSDLVKYAVNQMNLIKNNLVSFNSREMSLMSPLCIIVCKKCSHSTAYFSYTFQYVIILV